jgi:hypothetical protein
VGFPEPLLNAGRRLEHGRRSLAAIRAAWWLGNPLPLSAAEQFAVLLGDNGAALLGQRTAGAGCGYENGGDPAVLPHSGIRVLMPNCVRFRASGENEIAGIAPDVEVRKEDELRSTLLAMAE